MTKHYSFNKSVWKTLSSLSKKRKLKDKGIDDILKGCLKELYSLGAKKEDVRVRLFALAIYCQKNFSADFQNSRINRKFSKFLNWEVFDKVARSLIEKDSYAVVVFWVILRSVYGNEGKYQEMDKEMKRKTMEITAREGAK